jgi:hypothetical protein
LQNLTSSFPVELRFTTLELGVSAQSDSW